MRVLRYHPKMFIFPAITMLVLLPLSSSQLTFCLDQKDGLCNSTPEVRCVHDSTVNCIYQLENGLVNFTIASGNIAALASQTTRNLSIIGETLDNQEQVVVLISNQSNSMNNNGRKYCHPGDSSTEITTWMLNEYRRSVLKEAGLDICQNKSLTTLENEYDAWNTILGPSCIPGPWSPDDELDTILKKRYPKLTELCQYYQDGKDGLLQSLDCLVSNKGDVAVTSSAVATSFIEKHPNTELYFVCKNGTITTSNNPCPRSSQSGTLFLTNKYIIDDVVATMRYEFPDKFVSKNMNNMTNQEGMLTPNEKTFLDTVIFKNKTMFETTKTGLKEYMEDIHGIPSSGRNICGRQFTWCTTSEKEYEKCLWMNLAAVSNDINLFECKLLNSTTSDRYECVDDILKQQSDVTFVENKQMYTAMKGGLKLILVSKDSVEQMTRPLLIVYPTNITSLSDLKHKNACFAQAFDVGFVSFVHLMKKDILTGESCLYDEGISKFVDRACIPGIRDKMLKASANVDFERICKQCEATPQSETAVNCNANPRENLYAGNQGALECLKNNRANYGVITLDPRLKEHIILPDGTAVMCRNGTRVDTAEVDDACYLGVLPTGGIVVEKNNKQYKDLQLAIMTLSKLTKASPFNIFQNFQGEDNLLFPNSLDGFVLPDGKNSSKYVQDFTSMMNSADKCSTGLRKLPTSSEEPKPSSVIWITAGVIGIIVVIVAILGLVVWRGRNLKRRPVEDNTSNNQHELSPLQRNGNNIQNSNQEFPDRDDLSSH